MAQDHKKKIDKQIEGWGYFEHLIRVGEFENMLRQAMIDLVEVERNENKDRKSAAELVDSFIANAPNQSTNLRELKSAYTQALNHWEKALDADKRFLRVNRKFNIQSVVTRLFTTLTIGFSVMIVYWVAFFLKIPMPLLRIPM